MWKVFFFVVMVVACVTNPLIPIGLLANYLLLWLFLRLFLWPSKPPESPGEDSSGEDGER